MREQWDHTSQLVSMIHNVNCSKKNDQKSADHFNPMIKGKKKVDGFTAFKALMRHLPQHDSNGLIKKKGK